MLCFPLQWISFLLVAYGKLLEVIGEDFTQQC